MIIGLTGYIASGKDAMAKYLEEKSFIHISLSDILREELRVHGKDITRNNLDELGSNLRERFGPGVLAQRALAMVDENKDYVISSIGTVGEVLVLKKHPNFTLVFVDAPLRIRWNRLKIRNREKDPKTYKDFKTIELRQSKGGGKHYRAFDDVRKIADIILVNDKSLKNAYSKMDRITNDIRHKRPSWDDYFISIVNAVGLRGTCDRGKSGALFVKDNRILATGYVGSPSGLPHCDDVGHLFDEVLLYDGKVKRHCVRTIHAEQNAIAQAARHGVPIDGSTCYVTMEPCYTCAKMLINAGVVRVVASKRYHAAHRSREIFRQAGVMLNIVHDEILWYPDQERNTK